MAQYYLKLVISVALTSLGWIMVFYVVYSPHWLINKQSTERDKKNTL